METMPTNTFPINKHCKRSGGLTVDNFLEKWLVIDIVTEFDSFGLIIFENESLQLSCASPLGAFHCGCYVQHLGHFITRKEGGPASNVGFLLKIWSKNWHMSIINSKVLVLRTARNEVWPKLMTVLLLIPSGSYTHMPVNTNLSEEEVWPHDSQSLVRLQNKNRENVEN